MEIGSEDIQTFVDTVKSLSTYDFSQYSDKSLKRRLSKILIDRELDPEQIIQRISSDGGFLEQIVKDITVNTTEMFRDPPVWHSLRYDIIPLFRNKPEISIWHPGCSTGEEVYSMMILLNELGLLQKTRIYGTDLNSDVIESARRGIFKYRFNEGYLTNFDAVIRENPRDADVYFEVPYEKYFKIDRTRDFMNMEDDLVGKPVFAKQDLVSDPNPFDEIFDLILCRNVIIYFNYELQNKVFKLFLDNMNQGSCLVLGVHESILGPFASRFDKKFQAYFKK
jgi:chemotaxis protein methyltransferase CheR